MNNLFNAYMRAWINLGDAIDKTPFYGDLWRAYWQIAATPVIALNNINVERDETEN